MEKTKPDVLRMLEDNYAKGCNDYVAELARMWDIALNAGCFWIGDVLGGVYDFDGAWTLDMQDIRYAVRHAVTTDLAEDWQEYVCWACENDFEQPSLQDYVEARVPIVPREAQQRINDMRQQLNRLCAEERDRICRTAIDRENMTRHVKE